MPHVPDDIAVLDEGRFGQLDELSSSENAGAIRAELVQLFLTNAARRVDQARSAERAGDRASVLDAIHSLKGMASMIGAARLEHAAWLIEVTSPGLVHDERDPLSTIEEELARVRQALRDVAGDAAID